MTLVISCDEAISAGNSCLSGVPAERHFTTARQVFLSEQVPGVAIGLLAMPTRPDGARFARLADAKGPFVDPGPDPYKIGVLLGRLPPG